MAVTVAPGTAPPLVSLTTPLRLPVVADCALTTVGTAVARPPDRARSRAARKRRFITILQVSGTVRLRCAGTAGAIGAAPGVWRALEGTSNRRWRMLVPSFRGSQRWRHRR